MCAGLAITPRWSSHECGVGGGELLAQKSDARSRALSAIRGSLGASGGDGSLVMGNAEHILEATSSLDRNMNGCGYCDTVNSPCTDTSYASNPDFPEWDFRMVYEVWLDPDAFGNGLCGVDIDYVHASLAKTAVETIIVVPDDCPPSPGPAGRRQRVPEGYVIDLTSGASSVSPKNPSTPRDPRERRQVSASRRDRTNF